jgi:hypothetical protein
MRGRRSALLVPIAVALAPVILAQALSTPAFVVPTFADLTIKKRHSYGTTSSSAMTEVLYLKGARERREFLYEQPRNGRSSYATIMQCDQRRRVQLNLDARLYSVSVVEDWSSRSTRGRPAPEGQGAVVTTTFDSVDTGERRSAGQYVARRVRTTVTVEPGPGQFAAEHKETDGWHRSAGLGCSDAATTALDCQRSRRARWAPGPSPLQNQRAARRGTPSRRQLVSRKPAGPTSTGSN